MHADAPQHFSPTAYLIAAAFLIAVAVVMAVLAWAIGVFDDSTWQARFAAVVDYLRPSAGVPAQPAPAPEPRRYGAHRAATRKRVTA